MAGERMYILDTNVLVYDPESLFSFPGALVGIPIVALEELDQFKRESTDRGYGARETVRLLDELRSRGSLRDGVTLDNGSVIRILFAPETENLPSFPLVLTVGDNSILLIALVWKEKGYDIQFITKDINARVKADILGISAQDYLKGNITKKKFYTGWHRISIPALSLKRDIPKELDDFVRDEAPIVNEFVLAASDNNPHNYRVFRYLGGNRFKIVDHPHFRWPLHARNPEQLMALDLLCDPSIQFVTLFGPAGTGKTFLALLAGLHQVLVENVYKKILISRPVVPLGNDIGYLPGTLEEKLRSWMQPIYDNMEFILHSIHATPQINNYSYDEDEEETRYEKRHSKQHFHEKKRRRDRILNSVEELSRQDKMSLEAITYMRGRSIPFQYILIDEVQNLTPHEVKTLVSRAGEGSKIILSGDPYQIDAPYLDFSSNGLVVASNIFKGQSLFGTVFLQQSERSELSKLVSELW